jgi:hypothetical protein
LAEQQKQWAEAESQRADAESQRAEAESQQVAILLKQPEQLGIKQDESQ